VIHSRQTSRFEPSDAMPEMALATSDHPSTMAHLVALEQGLYALEIGSSPCMLGQVSSLKVPAVHVSALRNERERSAEIIGSSGPGDSWLDRERGTVIVKSPAGGAHVPVTAYGLPAQAVSVPDIHVRRLDRSRPNGATPRSTDPAGYPADEPEEIGSEIILHMEQLGDRRFPGKGWVGSRGKKLRIEAFSICPVDLLRARDIEFKALGPKGRQTPWVTDAKLCGTRGQGAAIDRVRDSSRAAGRRAVRCRLPGRLLRKRRRRPAPEWRALYSGDYRRPGGGHQYPSDPTVSSLRPTPNRWLPSPDIEQ
jgi:hypothetical protein